MKRKASQTELQPPADIDAERWVIGSMLLDNQTIEDVFGMLQSRDFYDAAHRIIFEHIDALHRDGKPADVGLLVARLKDATAGDVRAYDDIGGAAYLTKLVQQIPNAAHVKFYSEIVKDKALRRRLLFVADDLYRGAHNGADFSGVLADAELQVAAIKGRPQNSGGAVLTNLADVNPRPIRWLWPGRVPLGKLTLLAGDPGLGKSFVTLDVAARVSNGAPWPDSPTDQREPAGVVLLSAEDDLEDTIRPRLDAAGADPRRIVALEAVRRSSGRTAFCLTTDLAELENAVKVVPSCRLVIIDPITAYLGDADSHVNAEIRAVLAPLAELAQRHQVALLAVTHLNKSAGGPAVYRAMGSLAFTAAARTVWAVTKDKDNARRRLFLPIKSNIAHDIMGLAYSIEPYGQDDQPAVAWEAAPIQIDADDALAAVADGARADRQEAAEFLQEALAAGPVPATEIQKDAKANGFSESTLRRAFKAIKGKAVKTAACWMWTLPGSTIWASQDQDGQAAEVGHLEA